MQRMRRWGLIALLVLLGLEVLTFAPKRINSKHDIVAKPNQERPKSAITTMAQVMHGVHLVETSEGKRQWELDSDNAQGFKEKGTWKLLGVRVKFFGNFGTYYTVTGDKGAIQTETKDMEIQGHVVTTTSEGYLVKSNDLKYSAKAKTLVTNSFVEMTGPKTKEGQFELSSKGMHADLSTTVMELKQDVKAVKAITAEKNMTIHSTWARINGKTNEAHFEDAVQVDLEAVRMTGNTADFVYESTSKSLKSLLLQGNVRVTDRQRWAAAQKAQVLFAENEFVLSGNPRVIQDENELRGEEIRFINGGKEVRVVKARARVENELKQLSNTTTKRPQP